jgi:hypothetical protein
MAPTPEPLPRLKIYGLFRMTRRGYLKMLTVEVILVLAVIAAGVVAMVRGGQLFPEWPTGRGQPRQWYWQQMFVAVFWAGLLGLLLQMIEVPFVLKRFARAEIEQKGAQATQEAGAVNPPPEPSPTSQPSTPENTHHGIANVRPDS